MEDVNFTIFLEGLWFPCWLQSASFRRLPNGWFCSRLIRIFGYALDTPARQNQINLFCARLIRIFVGNYYISYQLYGN